ncbi:MAG: AAA family ATPase [Deltaproteobacteria bacterium]|nr:MAG: AAA family ATPase [Deltaproteobacteria bacterium]
MVDLRPYTKLHSIQLLKQVIRKWWGLELAFSDAKGYVLDHAEGRIIPSQNDFCRAALFSKEGFRRCNESVKVVRDRLRSGKRRRVVVHSCHMGFDIVAAPIHIDDELAGFLFTGGSTGAPTTSAGRAELLRKVREFAPEAAPKLDDGGDATIPRLSSDDLERLQDLVEFGAQEVMAYHEELRRHEAEVSTLSAELEGRYRFDNIIGTSPAIQEIFRLLEKICRSESTVLIHGESGTGKELIARAIHYNGPRAKKPFVVQNCSAFNDNLLESALFGHVRGAFTGAVADKQGLFAAADGGTFFLDEIGDMSPALQVKLLRVLQEGTFTPVGATKPVHVDVRVIAATHKDLAKLVERGEFREDLYYRVNVLKVTLPPLRDRVEDIPLLVAHFLAKHYHGKGTPPRLSREAMDALQRYRWPGNIRELENEIERLIVLGADQPELGVELLSQRVRDAASQPPPARAGSAPSYRGTLKEAVEALEAEYIYQGLIRTHWNKSQLAKELGISRSNLIQKCAYYGLDRKPKR